MIINSILGGGNDRVKVWDISFDANQTGVVTLVQDAWLADHYSDDNLFVLVRPLFDISQPDACTYGAFRANFSVGTVSGQNTRAGYRGFHTANNTVPSITTTEGVLAGITMAGLPGALGAYEDGTLKINAPTAYPLIAGAYKITAVIS